MKYIMIGVVLILCVIGAVTLNTKENYQAPEVIEKEVIKEVDPRDEKIRQREVELTEAYEKIRNIEARLDVLKAEREELDTEIVSLQKELAVFIQEIASKN